MRTKTMGRPAKETTLAGVEDTQHILSISGRLSAISSVTGRPLNKAAMACLIWYHLTLRERALPGRQSSWKPPTPIGVDLEQAREQAIRVVCKKLNARARAHVARAFRGETVLALRMTDPGAYGPRYCPAIGDWPGLPGLYSHDWPTTIGLPGEATRELADEAVRRGAFELVPLDHQEVVDMRDKLRSRLSEKRREPMRAAGESTSDAEPDEAAIWEEVVRAHKLGSRKPAGDRPAWGGERKVQHLVAHANEWEHRFPGSEAMTGRKPLPPGRA
jgi:hypothetical protein